jgi:polyhydroxyalkanoate synthesis regulator phasin
MAMKAATFSPMTQIQDSIRNLQSESEKLLDRACRQATDLIGRDPRKVIRDLLDHVKRIRDDVLKSADKAAKTLQKRVEKTLSQIDTQATKRLAPLVSRLSLPSKREVEFLSKRLTSLEKKVDELARTMRTDSP